jgi:hypothetical protein
MELLMRYVLSGFGIGVLLLAGASQARQRAETPAPVRQLSVAGAANAHPSLAADGQFVAVVWGATSSGGTDVYLASSRNGGVTFTEPARVNADQGEARISAERPPLVALTPTAHGIPDLAVLWTAGQADTQLKLSRSDDGGRSFGPPRLVHAAGAKGNRGWASMAADAAGRLHVVWLDHRDAASASTTGAHAHGARQTSSAPEVRDGAALAQRSGVYHAVVGSPGGERLVARGVCYCCKTAIATGSANRVAAAWRHVYPGNLRDIAMATSIDGGRSFGGAQRVSEDQWAIDGCPENGPSVAFHFGQMHVAWPTVVGGANPSGAIFYAQSADGRQFSPRLRIPTLAGRDPEHVQLVPARPGGLVVAWDEPVNGRRAVVASRLQLAAGRVQVGAPLLLSTGRHARHPALATTPQGVLVAWTDGPAEGATTIAFTGVD